MEPSIQFYRKSAKNRTNKTRLGVSHMPDQEDQDTKPALAKNK
jgi:hypothetical protein